ncbi:uncharacterized protein ACBR49_004342 [Aulostomus maculatus]
MFCSSERRIHVAKRSGVKSNPDRLPVRLDIKRQLTARSDRVKSVDLHPTEPWLLTSLYNGSVVVWNHESQMMVKIFELCDLPVRVAKFLPRKHWAIAGADDMQIHVFNYNTLERVHMFEAHTDYIRSIAVHPTQPYILTCSDDTLIKLWDWDRKWTCSQVFEGHTHYVMQVVFNPKDHNQFVSCSLDRTIKVWQLGSKTPNFTLEGHERGVNSVGYYSGGDKPYLISGADDKLVKIWDYQNKTCVQTLEGHAQNVTSVSFHPELPVILSGSEDGTVRVWHSTTYRHENTLNYGMERVWCISCRQNSNSVALGYDEGSLIIKMGRDEPAMSMDSSGKLLWARHSEVQQAILKTMGDAEITDGEKLPLSVKDIASCEIYPQTIQHSPNGRFVVVCGDGEYIIYTAVALRNKSFGSAQEFVWAHDSSQYAIREGNSSVKIFKNFKEKMAFKPDFGAEAIFGGFLLGVRSISGLAFYNWENTELIRRIEIQPKHIFWSDSWELVCITTDESFFVLRYLPERVAAAQDANEMTEDGIEGAFEVLGEVQEVVKTGVWVGDCFIYTNSVNRLNYYVGGEIITISHLDKTMYLLGYIPKNDRLYLGDKELNILSYSLLLSVMEYQTAVMRKDFSTADKALPKIPSGQRTRVAHFLEKQGFKQQALAVSTDPEHKFELALELGELKTAYHLALEAESEQKWKRLAELASTKGQFNLAQECLHQAQDYGGLLLLATSSGNTAMVGKLAEGAEKEGKTNVAFLTFFLQGRLEKCLELLIKTDRLPEAAFLARTYLPSHVSRVVKLWKEKLSNINQKAADALADPTQYANLFPGLQQTLLAEQYLKETQVRGRPAAGYPLITANEDRNVLQESAGFVAKGKTREPEEVTDETVIIKAVTEAAPVEPVLVEELIPQEQESVTSAVGEESITTTELLSNANEAEQHVDQTQVQPMSSEVAACKEGELKSMGEEGVLQKLIPDIPQTEPNIVQFKHVEDIKCSYKGDNLESPSVTDAIRDACCSETLLNGTTSKTTMVTQPREAMTTDTAPSKEFLAVGTDVALEREATENVIGTNVTASEDVATKTSLAVGSNGAASEAEVAEDVLTFSTHMASEAEATKDLQTVGTNEAESGAAVNEDLLTVGTNTPSVAQANKDLLTVGTNVASKCEAASDLLTVGTIETASEAAATEDLLTIGTNVALEAETTENVVGTSATASKAAATNDLVTADNNVTPSKAAATNDSVTADNNVTPSKAAATNDSVTADNNVTPSKAAATNDSVTADNNVTPSKAAATNDSVTADNNVTPSKAKATDDSVTVDNNVTPSEAQATDDSVTADNNVTPSKAAATNDSVTADNNATPSEAQATDDSVTADNNVTPSKAAATNDSVTADNNVTPSKAAATNDLVTADNNVTPSKAAATNDSVTADNNVTPSKAQATDDLVTADNNVTPSKAAATNDSVTADNNVTPSEAQATDDLVTADNNVTPSKAAATNDSVTADNNVTPSKAAATNDLVTADNNVTPSEAQATDDLVTADNNVTPSEAQATDVLTTVDTNAASEAASADGMPDEAVRETIFSETPSLKDSAVRVEQKITPPPVPEDEQMYFENNDRPLLDMLVPVQTSSDSALDLLHNSLQDVMPVLKTVTAEDPEQSTTFLVGSEGHLAPAGPPEAELTFSPPGTAPALEDVIEEVVEEPSGNLEVEMNEEILDDMEDLDMEDIDTTDVNLDEEFLNL